MKFHFHLPSISFFKEPAAQDTAPARNRHAQEASSPPDVQPATTQRRHQHSSKSWLKKLLPNRKKTGMPAPRPQDVPIHQSTFTLGHPIWNAIDMAEKQVAESIMQHFQETESITQYFAQDASKTTEFKNVVQDCINRSLDALDEKLNDARNPLLSGQSLEIIDSTREHAKKCLTQSAHDACYALYAKEYKNEIAGIEKQVVGTIRYALSENGRDTLPQLKKKMQFCIDYGANALDQKFDKFNHILQDLLPGQSSSHIKGITEQAKERITQSTHEVRNVIRANANATLQIEKEVIGIIENALSEIGKDTLGASELKNRVQECIDHGLHALDQKFDHMLQNLLPWQTRDKIEKTKEKAKERVMQSACDACHDLYANEMNRIEEEVIGIIGHALSAIGQNTLGASELKNREQECIDHGLHELDQKFEHLLQNLPPWQSSDKIERTMEKIKEYAVQWSHDACDSLYANAKEMDRIEKDVAGSIANTLEKIGKDALGTSGFPNMVQECINDGLHAFDQKFDHILKNLPSWQSRDNIEKTRGQAKERLMQSANEACHSLYTNGMARIEGEVAGIIGNSLAEIGKDGLGTSEFQNMAQDCINHGLLALDQSFDNMLQNLLPGQSRDIIEKTRGQAKERTMQSAHEACYALYANEMNRIGGEVAGIIASSLPGMGKDTLTISAFKNIENMVQDYIKDGLNALDQTFDQIQQNLLPGQSKEKLERTRDHAKEHIIQSTHETCRKAGWALSLQKGSTIAWETGPLLVKRELSLHELKLNKENIAKGGFGSVSIFENENGDKLIGKTIHDAITQLLPDDDYLAKELQAYQTIYDAVGPHPNLVNAYGIAEIPNNNGEMKRTLLMDAVPGQAEDKPAPTGVQTFDALRKCWDAGKISSEKYWGAIQFIGRRLLDVTEHLGKAGVVHNDIKPENFLLNGKTGEPVLIDLGIWTKSGETHSDGTPSYQSPETQENTQNRKSVDERSDVFTVGASLLDGVERLDSLGKRNANEGLLKNPAVKNAEGNMVREPGTYSKETAYTRFMDRVMADNKDIRVDSKEAKKLNFLNDSMLNDDAAKEVITNAISLASKEEEKPQKEQWKKATPPMRKPADLGKHMMDLVDPFLQNPNLAGYATLWNESKVNPRLKKYLDANALDYLQGDLEQEAADSAKRFIADAPWFDAIKKITATVTIPSGVERNAPPRNPEHEKIVAYKNAVIQAKKDLEPHANIEDLRKYAEEAEAFLRNAMALKTNRPRLFSQIKQVKERAAVARRMAEIFDTELTSPGTSDIQERARELDPIWGPQLERKLKELELKELELKESQINS